MRRVLLKRDDIYKGYLILVNSKYKIKYDDNYENLEQFSNKYDDIFLDKTVNKYLQIVFSKINSLNKIVPVSGYRSLDEQEDIYFNSIKENGEEFTKKYVALPNASEHQTGLAIDLGLNVGTIDFIRPAFPRMGICEKFRKVSIDYGFIERYTEEKKDITNISSEEWHFRYVGYPHSKIMKQNNLCLEEYINYLKQYKYNPLKFENYEITYIPYGDKTMEIILNENDTVSGNNVDGFIITKEL